MVSRQDFHRKDRYFSMELGTVCVRVAAVSVTYPRPDHCKETERRRKVGRSEAASQQR